jgi:hypothetical protein
MMSSDSLRPKRPIPTNILLSCFFYSARSAVSVVKLSLALFCFALWGVLVYNYCYKEFICLKRS